MNKSVHGPTHSARATEPARRIGLAGVLVGMAGGLALALLVPPGDVSTPAPVVTVAAPIESTRYAPPAPTPPASFTIAAAGDVLIHMPVIRSAANGTDFGPLLAGIDDWVAGADLALCHLEVPITPAGQQPSGYPMFASPPQLVDDLAAQGWDGCSTASNHSVDRGYPGVMATLDALDGAGMGHVGTARSAQEQASPQLYVLERGGRQITVAHLSATYGLNGLPMPTEAPWAVDMLDGSALVAQAVAARDAGADLVLVSMHAGVEYTENLTDQQVTVAEELAASGAVDLIIGHHAHVPQRIERVGEGVDGGGLWVAYGLGNMLSNQSASCCDPRTSNGVLLTATVEQEHPGAPVRVTEVTWTATTVDLAAGHRMHALPDVLDDAAATTLSAGELAARQERVADAVGNAADERTVPPEPTGPDAVVVPRVPAGADAADGDGDG